MEDHQGAGGGQEDRLLRLVLVVVAAVVFLPMLLMAVAMPMMGWMWTGAIGGGGGMAPVWVIGMMLVPLVLLVLAGYALYQLVTVGGREDPALRELRLAYARGDLSDEEFEQRRTRLEREE